MANNTNRVTWRLDEGLRQRVIVIIFLLQYLYENNKTLEIKDLETRSHLPSGLDQNNKILIFHPRYLAKIKESNIGPTVQGLLNQS